MIEVRTQAELDAALRDHPGEIVACIGNGEFFAYGSSTVRAYGSSTVWASDSSTVRAYGSSTVRASDSSTVWASGSSTVRASGSVAVHVHGARPKVEGGVQIHVPTSFTAADWCAYHGLEITDGTVVLFKAVDDTWTSGKGLSYEPGTSPEAKDWEATAECGNGLHFVPQPWRGHEYFREATRYVACPVLVADLVVIDSGKVKAPRCGPTFAVDQDGIALVEVSA